MKRCDVLIVGGGGSGLAAAITAAELGKSVILIEKAPAIGGSTGWSIGSITAAGTPDQHAAGISDSPAEHLADMPAWAGAQANRDNMELCEVLTTQAPGVIEWLRSSGVEFIGPFEEPPHRKPRMHNVLPNSRSFIYHLSRRAAKASVEIYVNTCAQRLTQRDGRVTGVEARDSRGETTAFHAKAVVLAAGDFNASRDFKLEYGSDAQVSIPAVNSYATGDCHRIARDAGATILNGDIAFNDPRFRFAPPPREPWLLSLPPIKPLTRLMRWGLQNLPPRLIRPFVMSFVTTALAPEANLFNKGAILVNKRGETFMKDGEKIGFGIARQPEGVAYALMDARLVNMFSKWPNFISTAPSVAYAYIGDYVTNRPDLCARAATPTKLAAMRDMDARSLENSAMQSGLSQGPFLLLGPIGAYTILADAGLAVTPRLEVTDATGKPIPGLFAAGSTGQGGMLLKGHGHHLAWAFGSGRVAGKHAAEFSSHF